MRFNLLSIESDTALFPEKLTIFSLTCNVSAATKAGMRERILQERSQRYGERCAEASDGR